MGQMLMKGWAMCAEACDECSYPLMRDRKTLQTICVSCSTLLGYKLVEGVKMEEVDANKSTIKIEGKTRTINVVNKHLTLASEQLEEVKEVEEIEEPKTKMIDTYQNSTQVSEISEIQVQSKKEETIENQTLPKASGSFSQQDVLQCLMIKQMEMCKRLETEQDLGNVKNLVEIVSKLQTAIKHSTSILRESTK